MNSHEIGTTNKGTKKKQNDRKGSLNFKPKLRESLVDQKQ